MEIVVDHFPRRMRHAVAGAISAITVGLGIVAPGGAWVGLVALYLTLANRDELRLAPQNRRYRRWRGIWPFILPHEGEFTELKAIQLERVTSEANADIHGYVVSIEWPNQYPTWPMARKDNPADGEEYARILAAKLGLPIEDGPQMKRFRKSFPSGARSTNA
jgi:hypothetical protein